MADALVASGKTSRVPESAEAWRRRTTPFSSGEPYQPPSGNLLSDIAKSTTSALADAVESTVGGAGDLEDMKWLLARYIAQAGPLDMTEDVKRAEQTRTHLPTSEDVQAVTNRVAPEQVKDWIRHVPQTPFGQAAGFAAGFIDPTSLIPAGKALKMAKRMF